jgi:hypothetical protein
MRRAVWRFAQAWSAALCVLCSASALVAAPPPPTGWTAAEDQAVTTYTHASKAAVIMLRELPPGVEPNTAIAANMDKPGLCEGLSNAQLEKRSGGDFHQLTSQSATMRCVFVFAKSPEKNAVIFSLEQVGSNANADAALQSILDASLTDAGAAATPIVQATPKEPAKSPAPLSTGKLARASYPVGLVGMWRSDWVENQYRAFTGLTLVALDNTLIFTGGGYFINGVPNGTSLDDAGALEVIRKDPANAGRYSNAGGVITLSYADGQKETVEAKKDGQDWQLIFRNRAMSPKMTFMSGGYLTGDYSTQRITDAGGIFVVGADDYSFAAGGRFAKGGSVSMSSAAVSSVGGRNVRGGHYSIKGSALTLTYDDGETEIYSMYQESAGKEIWLNGQMYRPG